MADWVEVAYALPGRQWLLKVPWERGMTAGGAIERSGLLETCPEIDPAGIQVGIFGMACRLDRVLEPGDRVEIYRPLLIDPMESRRRRVRENISPLSGDDASL